MNREPDNNRGNGDQTHTPLMLRLAYRAAATRRSTRITVAAVALVALGLARLNYLTEQTATPPEAGSAAVAIQPQTPTNIGVQDSQSADSMDTVIAVTAPQPDEAVTVPSDEKKSDDKQTEWWLILAFVFLGAKAVMAAVSHLEKNGYTIKRWEDKINKKKKRDDDPAP